MSQIKLVAASILKLGIDVKSLRLAAAPALPFARGRGCLYPNERKHAMNLLEGWENFYVIVGSSAGALIGLQFVVVTLMADMPIEQGEIEASGAFTTPSVVHFGVVLLLSAIASIPWNEITTPAAIWGFVGLCGTIYTIVVARRLRRLGVYKPVFEDWLFHALLPFAAYAMITTAAAIASWHEHPALFIGAGAAMLLLFIGIHNAWDLVTHLVFVRRRSLREDSKNK